MDDSEAVNVSTEELARLTPSDNRELQQFIQNENQKSTVQRSVHELTETCFKKCITGSISSGKLAGKEESCVQNCVERFMDSNLAVLRHLEKLRAGQ